MRNVSRIGAVGRNQPTQKWSAVTEQRDDYRPGDIANGHRLGVDGQWHPITGATTRDWIPNGNGSEGYSWDGASWVYVSHEDSPNSSASSRSPAPGALPQSPYAPLLSSNTAGRSQPVGQGPSQGWQQTTSESRSAGVSRPSWQTPVFAAIGIGVAGMAILITAVGLSSSGGGTSDSVKQARSVTISPEVANMMADKPMPGFCYSVDRMWQGATDKVSSEGAAMWFARLQTDTMEIAGYPDRYLYPDDEIAAATILLCAPHGYDMGPM